MKQPLAEVSSDTRAQCWVMSQSKAGSESETRFSVVDPHNLGEASACSQCGRYTSSKPWLPPRRVEVTLWGKTPADFAIGPGVILVSDRVRILFEEHNIVGVSEFFPVEVMRIKGKRKSLSPITAYFAASIERIRVPVDDDSSGMIRALEPSCNTCGYFPEAKRAERIVFASGWAPPADIFQANTLPLFLLASEKLRAAWEASGLNNARFESTINYSFNLFPWEAKETSKVERKL